jgi:hypothetical protein
LAIGFTDASKSAAQTCASLALLLLPGVWKELGSCAAAYEGTPMSAAAAINLSHAVRTIMKPPEKR